MTPADPPDTASRIRVAVFGNSNSLLRTSYARRLAGMAEFAVSNFSIGGAPNASLLFSATQGGAQDYDYIIVEPAVTDAEWIRNGYHDFGQMDRNFRRFVEVARSRWSAHLILLVLPTIPAIELGQMQVRAYYRERARAFGITLIDFYAVFEQMFAAPELRQVFFDDALHLSPFLFGVLADLLRSLIGGFASARSGQVAGLPAQSEADAPCTLARPIPRRAAPLPVLQRQTALTTQTLVRLGPGDAVRFAAADESLLSSLVVNRQATSAVVAISSDAGGAPLYKDLRLVRDPGSTFMLHVVPLMHEMHARRFRLRVCGPEDADRPELEASSFQDRSRCQDVVELCGAVLLRERADAMPLAMPAATVTSDDVCIVQPALPGADGAALEAQLCHAIESAKHVLRDTMEHNALIPRRKADRVLRQLMRRLEKAESWSPGEVLRELASMFLKMGYLSAADMMVQRAQRSLPPGPRIQWLLEQIDAETKLRTPPAERHEPARRE